MGVGEAAYVLGLSERHTWRILAAYRKARAAALSHGNRGHRPTNATFPMVQAKIRDPGLEDCFKLLVLPRVFDGKVAFG